jgi:group I intron endonuclease
MEINSEKFNFVYITTNLINGKQYIGEHSTKNINDNYLGSGRILQRCIKKYGKSNFQKIILEYFNSKQEAFDAQAQYIIQYSTLSPNGYNISPKGGHNTPGCISEETKRKISESNKGKKNG